jgi:hypothetical protein
VGWWGPLLYNSSSSKWLSKTKVNMSKKLAWSLEARDKIDWVGWDGLEPLLYSSRQQQHRV